MADLVASLPRNKASGPDGILNEHLQQCGAILPHITSLMNSCLEHGKVPSDWRKCLLTVIPKGKGDPLNPSSWRGIAKRNSLSKLLSSLIAARLTAYLDYGDVIPPPATRIHARQIYSVGMQDTVTKGAMP